MSEGKNECINLVIHLFIQLGDHSELREQSCIFVIHLFHKYLITVSHVPATTLGSKETKVNNRAQCPKVGADRCCRDGSWVCSITGPRPPRTCACFREPSQVLLEPTNSPCSPLLDSSLKLWFSDFIFKPQPSPFQFSNKETPLGASAIVETPSNPWRGQDWSFTIPASLSAWLAALGKQEKVFA